MDDTEDRRAAEDLRIAALAFLGGRAEGPRQGGGVVTRAVLDVTVDGKTEIVTLAVRDGGELLCSCTGGDQGPHLEEALRTLAAAAAPETPGGRGAGLRVAPTADVAAPVRMSLIPGPVSSDFRADLARALDEVLTAIVRVGVAEARHSPTLNDALGRLVDAAPAPVSSMLGRFLGVLRGALSVGDVEEVARLLAGAGRLAEDLREASPGPAARRRLASLLGAGAVGRAEVTRLSERTLLELGREYLPGLERRSIERRYLACLETGEIFREERVRGTPGLSAGPVFRVVTLGLGEVEEGAPPKRLRLLQYAVASTVTEEQWSSLVDVARSTFGPVAQDYREVHADYPGLAEPFVLLAPKSVERAGGLVLLDAEGAPIPVARAHGLPCEEALSRLIGDGVPVWVAGRLVDAQGTLLLVPCSVGLGGRGERRAVRLA